MMPKDTRVDTIIASRADRTTAQEVCDVSPKSLAYVSTLSCRGILAIVAVIDIAVHFRTRPVTSKALAGRHHLSPRRLDALLCALVRHGILHSIRGAQGGYKLSRAGITVEEVLRAANADDELTGPPVCGSALNKTVTFALEQIERACSKALACISIEDLARFARAELSRPVPVLNGIGRVPSTAVEPL
jgi:Rrf2 family iron-sulfur cluster assembly transcriptional regulator